MGYAVILLGDELELFQSLSETLGPEPIELLPAPTADNALEMLTLHPFDVIVASDHLGDRCGIEFLATVRERCPDTVRLSLVEPENLERAIRAVDEGTVFRFLARPCEAAELAAALRQAIEQRELLLQGRALLATLRRQVEAMDAIERDLGVTPESAGEDDDRLCTAGAGGSRAYRHLGS